MHSPEREPYRSPRRKLFAIGLATQRNVPYGLSGPGLVAASRAGGRLAFRPLTLAAPLSPSLNEPLGQPLKCYSEVAEPHTRRVSQMYFVKPSYY